MKIDSLYKKNSLFAPEKMVGKDDDSDSFLGVLGLACLMLKEKVKTILRNGGLMLVYLGKKGEKSS